MSSTASIAVPTTSANEYLLQDHSGKLKITYYPLAPGPRIEGQEPGPLLSYAGPAGNLSFRGLQVEQQNTPLGQLISVVLKRQLDVGGTIFTFFLPDVVLGDTKTENFHTFAVTSTTPGNILTTGARIAYEIEKMHGTAKIAFLAQ